MLIVVNKVQNILSEILHIKYEHEIFLRFGQSSDLGLRHLCLAIDSYVVGTLVCHQSVVISCLKNDANSDAWCIEKIKLKKKIIIVKWFIVFIIKPICNVKRLTAPIVCKKKNTTYFFFLIHMISQGGDK